MNEYCPSGWAIIKFYDTYKVFGSWLGGYLYGDSWRLNSGITSIKQDEDYYYFYGHSGSCYKCNKGSNRISMYNMGVLKEMTSKIGEIVDVSLLEDVFTIEEYINESNT